MRVFAVSDVHIDYGGNRDWLFELAGDEYSEDVLILAGDLTDDLVLLEQAFISLSHKFGHVLYVPGNHELWVARDKTVDSIVKYNQICTLATKCGLVMEPLHIGSLSIVPMQCWYDFSFGPPSQELKDVWMDFRNCIWPGDMSHEEINQYFINKNEAHLGIKNKTLISFSHFLPRIDLMPVYVPQKHHYLYPALGTESLELQLRVLQPDIHIYGHSHLNRNVTIDGIKYINNAFGYPSEDRITAKRLLCVYEQNNG